MPGGKRIKTPPPPEDEPRYLTVVHPYPLNANLELHADRRTLALWLACCTGKDVLFAMFYKPSSPGMVIIEVDRDFDRFDDLLGSHTWSKFLSQPNKEQMDKSSKVFYCTYNTGRQVEKSGWRRVNIEEHWFSGWSANNAIIRHPYPKSSYCDAPSEAKTGAPMCRPLPQRAFPVPPPTPAPPVGSPEWLAARNANPSASPAPSSARKGRKGAPSDTASVVSTSSRSTKSFSSPPPPSPAPSSVMANYRAKNDVALKRGPPSVASVASAATSRAPSTVGSSSARSSRAGGAPPGLGPRLTSQSTSGRFDWSEDVERFEAEQINNPARSPAASLSSNSAWRQPPDPDGPIEPSRDYEYNEEDQPRHSTVAAMSDIFEDEFVPPPTSVRNGGGGGGGTRPPGLDDPDYDPWNPPADDVAPPASDQSEAGDPATLWEGYDAPRMEPPTKMKKKGEWECSQHGSLCSPGICKERARFERDQRMQKEREKWEEEKKQREFRRAKAQHKKENKKASSSSSSSGSGSDSDTSRDQDSSAPPPPGPEDWTVPWNVERADTQSNASSIRPAWSSVAGSDDDENSDGGASVARSRTTNTSSAAASRSSRAAPPPPASVSTAWRSKGPKSSTGNNGPTQVSPTSPPSRPATRQSAWDARSAAASRNPSTTGERSVWPSVSGISRPSSVSTASANGSDTGAARSSVSSSSARTGPGPFTPSASTSTKANGFPTMADTQWGDPIAMALAEAAREKSRKNSGSEDDAEGGKKVSKSARKRRNKVRTARVQAQAQVQADQASVLESGLDVELPPGGPGSSWGDPNVVW